LIDDCQILVSVVSFGFVMLNALDRLKELGVGESRPVGVAVDADSVAALDWARLVDLMRGIVIEAGCELAGTQVQPDASVLFGMIEHPGTDKARRILVKLAAWNEWGAQAEQMENFAAQVRAARVDQGLFMAPAGFSPGAREVAGRHRIVMLDAADLQEALMRLPRARQEFLWSVASAGDAQTPSCPMCLGKLTPIQTDALIEVEPLEEKVMLKDAIVAESLFCRRLWVVRAIEVQFLQPVRALEMEIEGTVHGELVCEGTLLLRSTAVVHGKVAARAMKVEDGAQLLADLNVLSAPLQPLMKANVTWEWRCRSGEPGCSEVILAPHEPLGVAF
jgi:hypothetical protein